MADEPALLLTDHAAAALLAISRASWWRGVGNGSFPKPVKIGSSTRWRRDEVLKVLERVSAERDGKAA